MTLQWLEIKSPDNEKTKNKKKRLQKSLKSKIRFQKLDQATSERQQGWLNFRKGKGAKKKVGLCPDLTLAPLRGCSILTLTSQRGFSRGAEYCEMAPSQENAYYFASE